MDPRAQKPITVAQLHHALQHIKRLILDEEFVFDASGNLREILARASVTMDENNDSALVEQLEKELHLLRGTVFKDELTGVLNRRGIQGEFSPLFQEARLADEHPGQRHGVIINDFSVLFFDIDNFKSINDTFGHDAGDVILKSFAATLTKNVRDIDATGRYGGEEFVVALLGSDEKDAYEKAEQIRNTVEKTVRTPADKPVTVSGGVASLRETRAETLEELITFADSAMYVAKKERGKNNTVRHSELKKSK
jgi:diguanylate cyclase (GGDEF)-like protein